MQKNALMHPTPWRLQATPPASGRKDHTQSRARNAAAHALAGTSRARRPTHRIQ